MISSGLSPSFPISEHCFPLCWIHYQAGSPSWWQDSSSHSRCIFRISVKKKKKKSFSFAITPSEGPKFNPINTSSSGLLSTYSAPSPCTWFHLYNNPMKWGLLFSPLYRWGNRHGKLHIHPRSISEGSKVVTFGLGLERWVGAKRWIRKKWKNIAGRWNSICQSTEVWNSPLCWKPKESPCFWKKEEEKYTFEEFGCLKSVRARFEFQLCHLVAGWPLGNSYAIHAKEIGPHDVPLQGEKKIWICKSPWWQLKGWMKEGDRCQRDKLGELSFAKHLLSAYYVHTQRHWGFSNDRTNKIAACLWGVYVVPRKTDNKPNGHINI